MTVQSVSFDDDDESELYVFSGNDLLLSHYDVADLDWEEVAERSAIDERRGLVIAQVAVLEDLIDEFIVYLEDPRDVEALRRELDTKTIGPRLDMLESRLRHAGLLDPQVIERIEELRAVARRRNQLAHGTIHLRPLRIVPVEALGRRDVEVEWVLVDRRSRESERISMAGLRQDLEDAIGAFTALLAYAERFVEKAPRPSHFADGAYLAAPT